MTTFEIYKDSSEHFRWRLIARNGEPVALSEGYMAKAAAIESAKKVVIWAGEATIVDLA